VGLGSFFLVVVGLGWCFLVVVGFSFVVVGFSFVAVVVVGFSFVVVVGADFFKVAEDEEVCGFCCWLLNRRRSQWIFTSFSNGKITLVVSAFSNVGNV
jgi:hypothetical protein